VDLVGAPRQARWQGPPHQGVRPTARARASRDATREFRVAAGWTHAAVKLSDDHGLQRLFLLEAADREDSYAHGALFVRGRHRLVEKVNNPTQASVRWKALGRGD